MSRDLQRPKRRSKPLRVLIIDDCAAVRRRLALLLATIPRLEVIGESEDGRLGLEAIRRLKPEVVTLDLTMPVMGGLDVLDKLKQEGRRCRVIILAALINEDTREQCLKSGASAVFDKMHELDQFLQVMKSL